MSNIPWINSPCSLLLHFPLSEQNVLPLGEEIPWLESNGQEIARSSKWGVFQLLC